MLPGKCRPLCLGLNVLIDIDNIDRLLALDVNPLATTAVNWKQLLTIFNFTVWLLKPLVDGIIQNM